MTTYSDAVVLDQKRNGVLLDGKMTEKRVKFDLRSLARDLLAIWLAETKDSDMFTALALSPSRALYGGTATSTATLTASDKITPALISKAAASAKLQSPVINAVKVDGRDKYVLILHPQAAYDLKSDSDWQTAQRDANVRGMSNPIFSGALGEYDGVIVHEHVNIGTSTTYGSGANVNGCDNLFLGRQAGLIAYGGPTVDFKEKAFDYDNQAGFAVGVIKGETKAVFNSEDYAVIMIYTAHSGLDATL